MAVPLALSLARLSTHHRAERWSLCLLQRIRQRSLQEGKWLPLPNHLLPLPMPLAMPLLMPLPLAQLSLAQLLMPLAMPLPLALPLAQLPQLPLPLARLSLPPRSRRSQ